MHIRLASTTGRSATSDSTAVHASNAGVHRSKWFKRVAHARTDMNKPGLYARQSDRLGRAVQLGVASGRVLGVSFPAEVPPDAETDHPLLDRVFDYLDGAEDDFDDADVALTVPTDQRRVLEALRKVPYGRTVSVEKLVGLAGFDTDSEEDRRTVETALRENPVPLFVPDHRVRGGGATPPEVAETLRDLES